VDKKDILNIRRSVGKRIKIARIEGDVSQDRLAEWLGVTQKTISAWENGRSEIGTSVLYKIALALGKSPDYFLTFPTGTDQAAQYLPGASAKALAEKKAAWRQTERRAA
jgi:transcriptional regulator with XRE-family HTH domain